MKFPRASLFKLLVFALFSTLVLSIMWNTLNNATRGSTLTYTAHFADASGLRQGDSVRVAGVVIGKVDEIKLVHDEAEVRFRVQEDHQLFANTRVLIRYENLIGQRYLSLRPGPGEAEALPDGGKVPASQTESALDLSTLLNGFNPLFEAISPDDINRLATTIVQVLQGEGATLNELIHQIGAVAQDLGDHDRVIGRVIDNLADVVTHLAGQSDQFTDLLKQARGLTEGLAANRGVIGSALDSMDGLSAEMTDLLVQTRPDIKSDVAKTARVLGIYAEARGSLNRILSVSPDFFARGAAVAQYGTYGSGYLCEIQVHVAGVEQALLDLLIGDKHSEVCR